MKSWKKILTVGAAVLGAVALTACSNSNSSGSGSNAKVTIRVGLFDSGTSLTKDQAIAKDYEKAHPNVTISLEADPSNYGTKLQTELAAGTAPDLFQIGDGDIAGYQAKGAFADLTSYVKGSDGLNLSDYQSNIMDIGIINSKYYVLPINYSTQAVYYNKSMFDKAGIAYPSSNWTWADFEADAQKLTLTSGGNTTQWGVILANNGLRSVLPFLYSYGGDVISSNGKTVQGVANSADSIAGWTEFNKLINVDKVAPGAAATTAANGADLFLSGKAAMNMTGVWPGSTYVSAKMDFGVAPMPKGPAGQYTTVYYSGYGMYANSKNKSAAWDFLKYLETTGQDDQAQMGNLSPYIPAQKKYNLSTNVATAEFVNSVSQMKMFPERSNPNFTTSETALQAVQTAVYAGNINVKSQLNSAAATVQAALDKANSSSN